MKKLMLGVLILIPIIVVLTIGLVANFVSVKEGTELGKPAPTSTT